MVGSWRVLVILLGIVLNYALVLSLFIPWLSFTSVWGFLHTAVFTSLNVMLLISYGLAAGRDPGQVPLNYNPDLETSQHNSGTKEPRFCDKCNQLKPPRAHHCRVCKRCILRMDHHCHWLDNCVGHKNYKAFILIVFYFSSVCIHAFALVLGYAVCQPKVESVQDYIRVLYAFAAFAACLVSISWLASNLNLLLQNKTIIEYKQGNRERWLAEKVGQVYRYPYDMGAFANLVYVLGPKLKYWLCPMSVGHIGSGLWSRTSSEHRLCEQTS